MTKATLSFTPRLAGPITGCVALQPAALSINLVKGNAKAIGRRNMDMRRFATRSFLSSALLRATLYRERKKSGGGEYCRLEARPIAPQARSADQIGKGTVDADKRTMASKSLS
jgi:hypothetical protein